MEDITIETTKPAADVQPATKTKAKKASKRGSAAKKPAKKEGCPRPRRPCANPGWGETIPAFLSQ